jgi:hypothetical protein
VWVAAILWRVFLPVVVRVVTSGLTYYADHDWDGDDGDYCQH